MSAYTPKKYGFVVSINRLACTYIHEDILFVSPEASSFCRNATLRADMISRRVPLNWIYFKNVKKPNTFSSIGKIDWKKSQTQTKREFIPESSPGPQDFLGCGKSEVSIQMNSNDLGAETRRKSGGIVFIFFEDRSVMVAGYFHSSLMQIKIFHNVHIELIVIEDEGNGKNLIRREKLKKNW